MAATRGRRGTIRTLEQEEPSGPGGWFQFAAEPKETGELVGDPGFRVEEDGGRAEVGYTLAREYWGRG